MTLNSSLSHSRSLKIRKHEYAFHSNGPNLVLFLRQSEILVENRDFLHHKPCLRSLRSGSPCRTIGITMEFCNATQRTTSQHLPSGKNVDKKVGNVRACGSQWRAAGVPQAVRTVLYFSATPQVPADCGVVYCVSHTTVG